MNKFTKLAAIALSGMLLAAPAMADGHGECTDDMIKVGEKQFKKCKACHKLEEGKKGIGPHLANLAGREVAAVDGFKYSKAMAKFGEGDAVWDWANFDQFIKKPKKLIKGTKMAFGGIKKEEQRSALFCYLESEGGGSS